MEHSNYICTKCGAACNSKDPNIRSVFLHNQPLAMAENAIWGQAGIVMKGNSTEGRKALKELVHSAVHGPKYAGLDPQLFIDRVMCYHTWVVDPRDSL